jgi:hypothetical protein
MIICDDHGNLQIENKPPYEKKHWDDAILYHGCCLNFPALESVNAFGDRDVKGQLRRYEER